MIRTFARTVARLVALAGVAAAGCSPATGLVPNPTYQAWASFEPNSSVTFQSTRTTGQGPRQLRITQRLVERTPDRVILERTVQNLDANASRPPVVTRKVEPAMIDPVDNPRTRPEARVKDLGQESVHIKDRAFPCRVSEVEVHARFGEPLPAEEDLRLRTWVNPDIPGGTARMVLVRRSASHNLELSGQAVDFQVARRQKE